MLGDAGDPRFAERTPPWFGAKGLKSEQPNAVEAAEADVHEYEKLSRGERTRRYYEFKKRIDGHRDEEVRRTGSRDASWESQITGKFGRFYDRLALLFEEVTGLLPDRSPQNRPRGKDPELEEKRPRTTRPTTHSRRGLARRSQLLRANNSGFFGKTYTAGEIGDFLATQDDVPRLVLPVSSGRRTQPARRNQLWHANKRGFFGRVFTEEDLNQFDQA